jgi:pullulanase
MKKIFILLTLLMIPLLSVDTYANDDLTTLRVYYYRYDDTYTGFNMWVWENLPVARGGKQWDFTATNKDEYGVYYDIDLVTEYPGATRIGIIIKQGGWDGYREIGGDRFIDLADVEIVENGRGHAYFVEQDINIGTSQADLDNNLPDYRDRILQANFVPSGPMYQIQVSATGTVTNYAVYENGSNSPLLTGTASSKTFNISGDFAIDKTYTVEVTFSNNQTANKTVSLEKIYDTTAFEALYTYEGDLGVSFDGDATIIRVWAPLASELTLNIYNQGHPEYNDQGEPSLESDPAETHAMTRIENGAWEIRLTGDYDFKYYTFSVNNGGITVETTDPYAYSAGANAVRSMIVNFDALNPEGWEYNSRPQNVTNNTDYIIYELHVRDLTTHSSWTGTESYRGKFLGVAEKGTTYTDRNGVTVSTGLDHIRDLGVNAVHLLPIADFGYVDEVEFATNPLYDNLFNWGYMTMHFNVLEGTFSSNPFDGRARVSEFKQLVQSLHDYDIHVIMDVVYNHTGSSEMSNFHQLVPGYYHRLTETGGFSNGSGTGNETASERSMMRKFIVDSTEFLVTEYNLSGLRFDLMALHDVETMNALAENLYDIDPTILIYGEPWMGGTSPLPLSEQAGKNNIVNLNDVAAFNDVTRDALKGSVFNAADGAWLQGEGLAANFEGLKYGIVGGIEHIDVDYVGAWHLDPEKIVNYASAHDNNTLFDKLVLTGFSVTRDIEILKQMQIQANAIVLTSQGVPFIHAGAEFMRSKPLEGGGYDHNSYESPDSVNQLRWDRKAQYNDVFEYYQSLIYIRKAYEHFRMTDPQLINSRLQFLDTNQTYSAIAYRIVGMEANDPEVIVIHSGHNPTGGLTAVALPQNKDYHVLTFTGDSDAINGLDVISGEAYVPARTTMILTTEILEAPTSVTSTPSSSNVLLWIGIAVGAVSLISIGAIVIVKKKQA